MTRQVAILINGERHEVPEGVSLASVIHATRPAFRRSPVLAEARGLYCGMGVCFECMVALDGQMVRACITPVRDAMSVEVSP